MSVLLQNSTIWNRTTAAPSHTMPFDTSGGGSNLALGVSLAYYSPGGELATSVTYGGDPLTKRVKKEDADGNRCEFWTRPNIQTGPELNVVVTFNFSADPVICARSVQNVDQTTEVSHVASGTKASNSSLDIVSASGELVLDMVAGYGAGTATVGAGQASNGQASTGNVEGFASYEAAVGSSVTMSWTHSSSAAQVAVSFKEAVGSGGTYDESLALNVASGLSLSLNKVLGASMTLDANAAQGPAPSTVMVPGLSFSAIANQTQTNQVVFQALQVLAADAGVSWLRTLTRFDGMSLAGSVDVTFLKAATVNTLSLCLAEITLGASFSHTLQGITTLATQAAINWAQEISGIVEILNLAAVASQSQNGTAIMHALETLSAIAGQVQTGGLQASSLLSLPVGAALESLGALEGVVAALTLGVNASLSTVNQSELIGQLTLSLQSVLTGQAFAITNSLLALGIQATVAHTASMAIMEGVLLQVQAALAHAAATSSPEFGEILRIVAWSLTMPTVTGEALSLPGFVSETIRTAGPVAETLTV